MPPGQLWSLVPEPTGVMVQVGTSLLRKYGHIVDIKASSEEGKEDKIKVFFSANSKPRLLALKNFSWNENELCRKFHRCQTADKFVQAFSKEYPVPYSTLNTPSSLLKSKTCTTASTDSTDDLLPATKRARMQCTTYEASDDSELATSDLMKKMDATIDEHFLGYFMLPVKSLREPPPQFLVRDCNEKVVSILKEEMIVNPFADVQPILCMVWLKEGEIFDKTKKEGFLYHTLGGNHSRQALQEILKENPHLQSKVYTNRLCAVYKPMEVKLARRLGSKHNRAATFCHEMTTFDWVVQCRKLLFEMAGRDVNSETPSCKPEGWKKSCAAVLALTVSQLDERMVFYLASLPKATYNHLVTIFNLHSQGKLKDQTVPRSKKGITSTLNLKGSTFKCFRGLSMETVATIFEEIADQKLNLKEAAVECSDTKALKKVQDAFVRGTKSSTWDKAVQSYPNHCTSEMLEPFKSLNLAGELPNEFKFFCSEATSSSTKPDESKTDAEGVFHVCSKGLHTLIWKTQLKSMEPSPLYSQLNGLNIQNEGFTLSILDYAIDTSTPEEILSSVKDSILAIRALNYHKGLHSFSVVVLCNLDSEVMSVLSAVRSGCDVAELAVCGIDKVANSRKSGTSLLPTTIALLIGRIGEPTCNCSGHANFFSHEMDALVVDPATKAAVYGSQKPVSLYSEVIKLYSAPGDWVLSGPDSAGSCALAGSQTKRNILVLINNGISVIHSKIRLVKVLEIAPEKEDEELSPKT